MIDRDSRDRLAEALRHYVSGQITNDDLYDVEIDWRDRGAKAVWAMAWGLYDDNYQHKATGPHYLGKNARREITRWIAFLYSDEEYTWPEYNLIRIVNWPLNLLTFGWWERMKESRWKQFLEAGDTEVWPFCKKQDLERISREPRLLAGSPRATP